MHSGAVSRVPCTLPQKNTRQRWVVAFNRPPKGEPVSDEPVILNPVELGRRSRQALDEVWAQVTRLSSPTSSFSSDAFADGYQDDTFQAPQAPFTNVLVVGGTGRIGRILVRKLLLRGYPVKVMVRDSDGTARDKLPAAVELCVGDVGNLADCQRAMEGVDKVIYCASSSVAIAADMMRVDQQGVRHMAQAFMDLKHRAARTAKSTSRFLKTMVADFADPATQESWDILQAGTPGGYGRNQDKASAIISSDMKRLEFEGTIYSRNGIAEWGGPIAPGTLGNGEGVIFKLLADGKPYQLILSDNEGHSYAVRFNTRLGYNNFRAPFNTFRAMDPSCPPLDPSRITVIKFRFDKSQLGERPPSDMAAEDERAARNTFAMELVYIKRLPSCDEPAFVLVSCAGDNVPGRGIRTYSDESRSRKLGSKRKGEQLLRNCGLPYTIMRPGPLLEEPGGYKAMVFDQGNRISQGIGFADVADVCLRALHEEAAVNKTFEVCYEYAPAEGLQMYELVAHLPGKFTNYLTPALAPLEKNT